MKAYKSFEDLPGRKGYGVIFLDDAARTQQVFQGIDWAEESFKSTNSALNLRTSIIQQAYINNKT